MLIYKTRWFDRWARKEGLNDLNLCAAVEEMAAGLYEADLGGGLFKKRVARSGKGKRSGFRTLIATNREDRWFFVFFVFGFPKNERSNIDKHEEEALKKLASVLLCYTLQQLEKAKLKDELIEVNCNEKD
ncbi:type II toxin-antitoxin system RelE/ParE family toxin [Aetokthonos hydrillicola Thurmond2011]|jgi:hypothetical protein|uniref:Type II toxin-antitoxin system RelE/ParE family toxin n=1 Tax=Aetokthonos hydrillicola Thurmond2011 TaxID=2712845 RepID=A0AAP5I1F7_9CYAN|nr:type II toxin-antitoxin system RelE/ParE family toxin [Aetokthonos hydrillicola]MBW4588077.1 type II toxin-antitoxin system RelE/ParE family toxin [Aetokthonos hydrillicola CCALA 1050]MDR9893392.1 type II toxin-antitoxin system RelE/ParE family toxin [Aetokthonos hydrillicola Thurmond2011]